MAWAQVALVELQQPDGQAVERWCSHYREQGALTWDGQSWPWRAFQWSLMTDGSGGTTQATLTLGWTADNRNLLSRAQAERWLVSLRVYAADEQDAATTLPAAAQLLESFTGLVVGHSLSTDPPAIGWQLGSDGGGAFPPELATTFRIGTPCVL
jgi:hypothetical protein